MIGGSDKMTTDINRLIGQLPPSVQALTGVDISKILSKIPGATTQQSAVVSK